ncbi:LysR substrate-binding domain-containing protein [Ralstonia pseudosolanacearum]|uniref:Putative transcriptional regulator n=1 Tax=Ralstonia solanacearum TaxID=305 RepID=A0A0S4TWE1_RALSL|nr:LysR family transcriptional regulator [Ralstonia solanacearum]CUV14294.1 putative transcriptional regulator [Ralstonia solanacearum]
MPRENLHDILAFIAVARERSFTRAAAQLRISQSTLSHTVKSLEARMGVRLLTRTTRSVSPTEAGERLLRNLSPHFEEIEAELSALSDLRDNPAGTIRITATDYAANTIIWPKLAKMLVQHPDIHVEVSIDYGLRDIVADRYDIGVRFGDQVAKDMIAVRISPDRKMAVVASPAYLKRHPAPKSPQDLVDHKCINMRLPTHGSLLTWELQRDSATIQAKVDGQVVVSNTYQALETAALGMGLAYVPDDIAQPLVQQGKLRRVLEDWCPTYPGHHAYYPSRRQSSRALQLVIEALRQKE